MDDRCLKEYALNIYKGIRGYTLSKALNLFPKYYPKIVFYYTEMLTKQQSEFSLRMIQSLGIDKGIALMNELKNLNERMSKFYVNAKFRFDESYRKIEAATDEDRSNVAQKERATGLQIAVQTRNFLEKGFNLLSKIYDAAKKYNFTGLENSILETMATNKQVNNELSSLNIKFYEYVKQYQT